MNRRARRTKRHTRSPRAQAVFIAVGVAAAIAAAGIAVAMLTGLVPPLVAVVGSGALAAWVFAIVRLLNVNSDPMSLDCRDGVHAGCLICSCSCHRKA